MSNRLLLREKTLKKSSKEELAILKKEIFDHYQSERCDIDLDFQNYYIKFVNDKSPEAEEKIKIASKLYQEMLERADKLMIKTIESINNAIKVKLQSEIETDIIENNDEDILFGFYLQTKDIDVELTNNLVPDIGFFVEINIFLDFDIVTNVKEYNV